MRCTSTQCVSGIEAVPYVVLAIVSHYNVFTFFPWFLYEVVLYGLRVVVVVTFVVIVVATVVIFVFYDGLTFKYCCVARLHGLIHSFFVMFFLHA